MLLLRGEKAGFADYFNAKTQRRKVVSHDFHE
jgi:hypothetical protein